MATLGHVHVFICKRNPNAHVGFVPCYLRYVVCPECGSAAGETVRVVPQAA